MDREARITVESRVTDAATAPWTLLAQGNAHAPALRIKQRGRWRTWSWQEIGPVLENFEARRNAAVTGPNREDDAFPVALTLHDEVLLLGNRSWRDTPRAIAHAWTESGFVLALAESDGDELADLKEHRPSVVVGRSAFFEGWHADVAAAIGRQRGIRYSLLAPFLFEETTSPGILRRWVRRRLRASLGLGRARALWTIDETLSADAALFFRALEIAPVFSAAPFVGHADSTPVVYGAEPDSRAVSA
jgi:hypothetical protein